MKKPNARERILETAGDLFFRRGYSEVGINEIIEKAGTAKASFYQHFPSKEALCEAWLESVHERSEAFRASLLEGPGAPAERLARYFEQLEQFLTASEFRGCPYTNTRAASGGECVGICARIRQHKESTRRFFRELAAQALPDPIEAVEVGDRIFLLYSGATSEAQNLREIWPVAIARKAALSYFPA